MELKRELLVGRLSEIKRATSVLCAATGGIAIPTLITAGALVTMNLAGVRSGLPYLMAGAVFWLLFIQFGLHDTLPRVVVTITAPVRPALVPSEE